MTETEWQKIQAGSYGTLDGWNAWRVGDHWEIRSPAGEYHRAGSYREARALVGSLRSHTGAQAAPLSLAVAKLAAVAPDAAEWSPIISDPFLGRYRFLYLTGDRATDVRTRDSLRAAGYTISPARTLTGGRRAATVVVPRVAIR